MLQRPSFLSWSLNSGQDELGWHAILVFTLKTWSDSKGRQGFGEAWWTPAPYPVTFPLLYQVLVPGTVSHYQKCWSTQMNLPYSNHNRSRTSFWLWVHFTKSIIEYPLPHKNEKFYPSVMYTKPVKVFLHTIKTFKKGKSLQILQKNRMNLFFSKWFWAMNMEQLPRNFYVDLHG